MYAGKVAEKEVDLADNSNYYELLAGLGLNPETVIIFQDGQPVAFDAPVKSGEIDVMRVVSGG